MTRVLALSPHLDDAVFSAGGTLARLAAAGAHVTVATVFTATVPDPQGFALSCQLDKGLGPEADYMALRREEDRAACAHLGAEPRHLPFAEAPHRGYGSAPELFAGVRPDDDAAERIAPALGALLAELRPDLLFAPQAVGAHVDHVAVVEAVHALAPSAPVRKTEAALAYRSQLGFQFGGAEAARRVFEQAEPAERFAASPDALLALERAAA